MIQAFLTFFGGASIVRILTIATLVLFLKRLFLFLLYVALPFVIFSFGFSMFSFFLDWLLGYIQEVFPSAITVTLSGVGGYLYNEMYVGAAFSLVLSAVATRFITDFVRDAILRG